MRLVLENRMVVSKLALFAVIAVAIAAEHPDAQMQWPSPPLHFFVLNTLSLAMVLVAVLGRSWSAFYIGGRKNDALVEDGPYALCRNPLYTFSAIGILGISFQTHQWLLVIAAVLFILLVYPATVRAEEAHLSERFGEAFAQYCRRVPRFLPAGVRTRSVRERICVDASALFRAASDNIWWIIVWYLLESGEIFHELARTHFAMPFFSALQWF